jgi:ribonuclease Z
MKHFPLAVDHETVGPAYREMQIQYDGLVTIAQDLTVFNVTKDAIVVRQAEVNPVAWPVIGRSNESGPPMAKPNSPPSWWADALLLD